MVRNALRSIKKRHVKPHTHKVTMFWASGRLPLHWVTLLTGFRQSCLDDFKRIRLTIGHSQALMIHQIAIDYLSLNLSFPFRGLGAADASTVTYSPSPVKNSSLYPLCLVEDIRVMLWIYLIFWFLWIMLF